MKFRLYWLDKKTEVIEGTDIQDAFTKSGYGGGAAPALDYWEEEKEEKEPEIDPASPLVNPAYAIPGEPKPTCKTCGKPMKLESYGWECWDCVQNHK